MRPPAAPRPPRRQPGPVARREQTDPGSEGSQEPDASPDDQREPVPQAVVPSPQGGGRWLRRREREPVLDERPGFLERLAERARAQRRLAWRKILVGLGAVAALAGLAWLVLGSPVLALDAEEVTVGGVGEGTTVSLAQVMDVVEPQAGTPLARLDAGALTEQLETITTVRSVTVHRAWPTGLDVQVVARVPVAVAEGEEGPVLLDADGVVVGSAQDAPEGLPIVTVPLEDERVGQTLEAVLTVLAGLPEGLRSDVVTAGASSPASISFELTDGEEVRWGGVEESELKAAVLEVLREREAQVYDVTVPRTPTTSD